MNPVRIVGGMPNNDDTVSALESVTQTKALRNRPEIHLHDCPFCGATDNRGDGVQGAMSYSLEKHCFVCAKCNAVKGWKDTFDAFQIPWMVSESASSIASEVRSSFANRSRASSSEDPELASVAARQAASNVDHGDYRVRKEDALLQHASRLCAENSKVLAWLGSRGITIPVDYMSDPSKIWAGESKAGWLVLVYRNRDGSVRGFKYRNIEEKVFSAQAGAQSDLWNAHLMDPSNTTASIYEGELDAEVVRLTTGAKNCFSLPNGGQSATEKFVQKIGEFFQESGIEMCFVGTDLDEVGESAAKSLFELLPRYCNTLRRMRRLRFVTPDGSESKDANDAVMAGSGAEILRRCYAEAEDPDLVSPDKAEMNLDARFIETWPSLDGVLGGGALIGEVTHLAGGPKSGKTTIVTDLHQRLSTANVKSGFVALDQDSSKVSIRFGMNLLGRSDANFYKSSGEQRVQYTTLMREKLRQTHYGKLSLSRAKRIKTYKDAMAAIERMGMIGCKLITVEDYLSLSSMLEQSTKGSKVIFAGRRVATDLAEIADRFRCHIILINHLKDDQGGGAYGSGQIGPVVQANIHVSADRDENGKVKASIMHIKENRYGAMGDVDISMTFSDDRVLVASAPRLHVDRKKPKQQRAPKPRAEPREGDDLPF